MKLLFCSSLVLAATVFGGTIDVAVPGTSDPWLAGMPDGSTASSGDIAPTHSPVFVPGLPLFGGQVLTVAASGCVSHTGPCPGGYGPDGQAAPFSHGSGAENGIANVTAPLNGLLGLFLTDDQPSLTAAPAGLTFGLADLNFLTLSPDLKQPFFIGDGVTSLAVTQQFIVPTGGTRLYLGTMDGFGWFNNGGTINATITFEEPDPGEIPEPSTLALVVGAFATIVLRARNR